MNLPGLPCTFEGVAFACSHSKKAITPQTTISLPSSQNSMNIYSVQEAVQHDAAVVAAGGEGLVIKRPRHVPSYRDP